MMWGAAAIDRPPWSAATRPYGRRLLELARPKSYRKNLFGSARASALATIDRRNHSDALIVADLSFDPTYAEVLLDTFGPPRDRDADLPAWRRHDF